MGSTLRTLLKKYEHILLIEETDSAGMRLRARALYAFGWAFVAIQVLNLFSLFMISGGWTIEHWISVAAALLVLFVIHTVRYAKGFTGYAVFIALLACSAPLMTALYDDTGINSSLLPFLMLAPVANGFIAGPRAALATAALALCVVGILFFWSSTHPVEGAVFYAERNAQRAMQVGFGIILVSIITAVFSNSAFRAFDLLQDDVDVARRGEKAKEVFLATMSHEIRTPLNGVLGLTDALSRTDLTAEQDDLLQTIQRSGHSLMHILNDVLDLSKIDSGVFSLDEKPFQPAQLLDDLVALWSPKAQEKKLHFRASFNGDRDAWWLADEMRLRQVLMNLISNAVKFTQTGGVNIRMSVEEDDAGGVLSVMIIDTGCGVPREKVDRIFDPFVQANDGVANKFGGTGLGLAISKRLIEMHDGVLRCLPCDEGATFSFVTPLPRATPPKMSAPSAHGGDNVTTQMLDPVLEPTHKSFDQAPMPPEVTLAGKRVLIVDDDSVNQLVAKKMLEALNIASALADNGEMSLAMLAVEEFDAVLMDKHMPAMNGPETLQRLRAADAPWSDVPVIACTADAMAGEQEALLEQGFDAFVSKPVAADALEQALQAAFRRQRARDAKDMSMQA